MRRPVLNNIILRGTMFLLKVGHLPARKFSELLTAELAIRINPCANHDNSLSC